MPKSKPSGTGQPTNRLAKGLVFSLPLIVVPPLEASNATEIGHVTFPDPSLRVRSWSAGGLGQSKFGVGWNIPNTAGYLYTQRYTTNYCDFIPTGNCSVVFCKRKTDTTNRSTYSFGCATQTGTSVFGAYVPFSDGVVYWDYGGTSAGSTRLNVSSLTFGDDVWVFTVGARGMEIWQNGIKRASNTANPTRTTITTTQLEIGKGDIAVISCLHIYDRQLSPSDITILSNDPCAMYRSKKHPKGKYTTPAAGGFFSRYYYDMISTAGGRNV